MLYVTNGVSIVVYRASFSVIVLIFALHNFIYVLSTADEKKEKKNIIIKMLIPLKSPLII